MCKVNSSITVTSGLKVANKESRSLMFEVATCKKPKAGWLSPLKKVQHALSVADDTVTDDTVSRQHDSGDSGSVMHPECSWTSTSDDAWCCSVIDIFCLQVKRGLKENPDAFKPAIVKMHQLQAYAASARGLLTTLYKLPT